MPAPWHMGSVERKKRVPQKKPNKLETEQIGNLGFLASNSLAPPNVTPVMVQVPGQWLWPTRCSNSLEQRSTSAHPTCVVFTSRAHHYLRQHRHHHHDWNMICTTYVYEIHVYTNIHIYIDITKPEKCRNMPQQPSKSWLWPVNSQVEKKLPETSPFGYLT